MVLKAERNGDTIGMRASGKDAYHWYYHWYYQWYAFAYCDASCDSITDAVTALC
jgi:hypothetical protein